MKSKLSGLATDVVAAILAFRAATNEERPPYRAFRQELVDFLSDFERRAQRERLDSNGDAYLALIALADESVLSSDWEDVDEWSRRTLAMDLLEGELRVGDRFFERLEKLLRGEDEDVLEIYYVCLCAGFRGRHFDDPATLRTIRNRVYGRVVDADPREGGPLTPDAYGRDLERPMITRRFPIWWALPFVLGVIGLYGAYYVVLGQQAGDIAQETVADFEWTAAAPEGGR